MTAVATEYEIDYSCGHTEVRDLSDTPAGLRAGKAAWWAKKKCFDCFRKSSDRAVSKEIAAAREAEIERALEDQTESNLPLLRGSEKQINWAIVERFKILKGVYESEVLEGEMTEASFETEVLELARRIDVAKWWIDNREATNAMILELLADPGIELTANENPY